MYHGFKFLQIEWLCILSTIVQSSIQQEITCTSYMEVEQNIAPPTSLLHTRLSKSNTIQYCADRCNTNWENKECYAFARAPDTFLTGACYLYHEPVPTSIATTDGTYNLYLCDVLDTVDQCLQQPCLNGATCVDGILSYTCQCFPGFTGENCATNIEECESNPCVNGICLDGNNKYYCICDNGYEGANCEINTSVNTACPNPCSNGGTCIGGACTCVAGYTGSTCDSDMDDCAAFPCEEGCSCIDLLNGFRCNCDSAVTGTIDANSCATDTCQNGGTCADIGDGGYTCSCVDGFSGDNCATDINDCATNQCINGGTCVDGLDSYSCTCPTGYTGRNCSENMDECEGAPCKNGGTCFDLVSGYSCSCVYGYDGTDCEIKKGECGSETCENGGTCADNVDGFTCTCANGFTGDHCESKINDCDPNPCTNNGTCVEGGIGKFTCTCAADYKGNTCEEQIDDCMDVECENGGTCVDGISTFTCTCSPGYTGSTCAEGKDINDCDGGPCLNGGTCADTVHGYTCSCASGYEGTNCQKITDDCAASPCLNGGTCTDLTNGYSCSCDNGYEGTNCQTSKTDKTPSGDDCGFTLVQGGVAPLRASAYESLYILRYSNSKKYCEVLCRSNLLKFKCTAYMRSTETRHSSCYLYSDADVSQLVNSTSNGHKFYEYRCP